MSLVFETATIMHGSLIVTRSDGQGGPHQHAVYDTNMDLISEFSEAPAGQPPNGARKQAVDLCREVAARIDAQIANDKVEELVNKRRAGSAAASQQAGNTREES